MTFDPLSASTAFPPTTPSPSNQSDGALVRSCSEWTAIFDGINHYFRDEDILPGSEHSSVEVGYVIIMAYSLVIALGLFGNTLTIITILSKRHMRNVRNFFILNLAISDFFLVSVNATTTLYTGSPDSEFKIKTKNF
jgi:hypothetical protein